MAALQQWPASGIPEQPGRLAHGRRQAPRHRPLPPEQAPRAQARGARPRSSPIEQALSAPDLDAALDDDVGDDLLRLMFTACHPVLSTEARVALTLRLLGRPDDRRDRAGLSGLRSRPSPSASSGPSARWRRRGCRLRSRAGTSGPRGCRRCWKSIYLIFNEGYSATAGDDWMRPALCEDALRLGRILAELAPQEPEVHGLVALMEIQASRARARVSAAGAPILLLDQNRAQWDQLLIRRGLAALARAEALGGSRGAGMRCRPRSPPVMRARAPPERPTGRASPRCTRRWPRWHGRRSSS